MEKLNIPKHIGIIMDGNGRWAKDKNKPRSYGHKKGADNLKKLSIYIKNKGVKYLSVYAFSTENFKRDIKEVNYLMNLFIKMFKEDFDDIAKEDIKVVFSGRDKPLSNKVLDAIKHISEKTKDNKSMVLNVCLNYGSRSEMVDMVKKIINKRIDSEKIDEEIVKENLYNDLPDLDLVIRTSGEERLSNFMLYQASYAELYFPKVHFPDFDEKEFDKAIIEFNNRVRRFGGNDK